MIITKNSKVSHDSYEIRIISRLRDKLRLLYLIMLIISNFCIRKVGVKLIGWCVNQTGLINKFRQYVSSSFMEVSLSQSRPDEISDIISIISGFHTRIHDTLPILVKFLQVLET